LPSDDRNAGATGAQHLMVRVAESVRRHREHSRLSLNELAKKSGVSRSALSQIESATANPRLMSLWKIAASLSMDLEDLFRARWSGASVTRAHDHPLLRNAHARIASRLRARHPAVRRPIACPCLLLE
jgi:transcriptional regulator with XRE-family HTH domain